MNNNINFIELFETSECPNSGYFRGKCIYLNESTHPLLLPKVKLKMLKKIKSSV